MKLLIQEKTKYKKYTNESYKALVVRGLNEECDGLETVNIPPEFLGDLVSKVRSAEFYWNQIIDVRTDEGPLSLESPGVYYRVDWDLSREKYDEYVSKSRE